MQTRDASQERERISMAVVEAVAESSGTDPLDLTPPLSSVIDADALDRLYRKGADVEVQFEYNGHAVTVGTDGAITVDGTPARSPRQ
ncbi:HalOD1 output domain-containing protein [Halorientalis salina]|uniref:HalOD1 output domain-containing protein n=1 Tax=Halorientalis salina TaxID=2932266 RepID=UPI0010AC04F5|nr:HalOD1 output domain-containing protein [Halorientalis salina]